MTPRLAHLFVGSLVTLSLTGCFGDRFTGNNEKAPTVKKDPVKQSDQTAQTSTSTSSSTSTSTSTQTSTDQSNLNLPNNNQPNYVYLPPQINDALPPVQPNIQPPQPFIAPRPNNNVRPDSFKPVPPEVSQSGTLGFNAILFVNMENKSHATDAGKMAVLRDAATRNVIAAGDMSISDAAVRGESKGMGGAYPVTRVNVQLTQTSNNAPTSGNGLLSVCTVSAANRANQTFDCDKPASTSAESADRPMDWIDTKVNYTKSGDSFSVDNKAYGQLSQVSGGLSYSHPVSLAMVAANTETFTDAASPLVLDLNRNHKLDLTSVSDPRKSVRFDIDASKTLGRIGWIEKGDALLALDLNHNGVIDDGAELFGEYSFDRTLKTKVVGGKRSFKNGFEALAQYDLNKDQSINALDPVFKDLRVWADQNHDGITNPGELKSLESVNIVAIALKKDLTERAGTGMNIAGNEVRYIGHFRFKDGTFASMGDVWFSRDRNESSVTSQLVRK